MTEVITSAEYRRLTASDAITPIGTVITTDDLAAVKASAKQTKKKQRNRELTAAVLDQIAQAGLPAPVPEYRFARHIKRQWPFDFAYPNIGLGIEIEGGIWTAQGHVGGGHYESDCEKYSTAAILGWVVVRVTPAMIEDGAGRAIALIRAAYHTWRHRRFHPRTITTGAVS